METALTKPAPLAPTARREAAGIAAEAFDELVRVHQRRIYRVLLAVVRDPDAADTLTQECFLRAYRKRASFRGESSVGTWLVRIAVNLARDHEKNRRQGFWSRLLRGENSEAAAGTVPARQASPLEQLETRQDVAAVWQAAEGLSPQQRTMFVLRFVEEMTLEEIAEATGLEVGTVKSHLHRAVSAVRQKLMSGAQRSGERQE